jgi:hypothetical protein
MDVKALLMGLWGLLLLTTPAVAEPPLSATEKAYRLLQTISSQLQEVQTSFASSGSASATALAKAQEQVHIATAHCCHALYTAQLRAAKAALTQGNRPQALLHLRKADETLEQCPASPGAEPAHDHDGAAPVDALTRR